MHFLILDKMLGFEYRCHWGNILRPPSEQVTKAQLTFYKDKAIKSRVTLFSHIAEANDQYDLDACNM